jgi:hypothetical protein
MKAICLPTLRGAGSPRFAALREEIANLASILGIRSLTKADT